MKAIRYTIAILTAIYIIYATYSLLNSIIVPVTVQRCGEITFKGNRDQVHKHSTSTEFVLVVKYDDTGRKEDEHVSASTWSSFDVGDRICFTQEKRSGNGFFDFINFFVGFVGAFCCAVGIIILLVFFFRWVFIGKTFAETWEEMNEGP